MLDVYPISSQNLHELKSLYTAFQKVAQVDYGWPGGTIGFDSLEHIFSVGLIEGYLVRDFASNTPVGFMFYHVETFRALEIKVIYIVPELPVKTVLDVLMTRFIEDIKLLEGWDVLSYPMLGPGQLRYIRYITWYGFKPAGQMVVKFYMLDGISIEILQKQVYPSLPEGYRFISWDPCYEERVIDVLAEAFAESVDALWDPRFRSREGVKEALAFVQSGSYGKFWPQCCTILLNAEDKPVGVCLINIVSSEEANIPLIGVLKSERQKKLGRQLLAQTVNRSIDEVLAKRSNISIISATTATGNISSVRMYRNTSFQEEIWYPHVYQEKESVLKRRAGQWC